MTTASGMTAARKQHRSHPTAGTKSPNTLWDAPGMQRIKIPFGGLSVTQLETLAELAEEYSAAPGGRRDYWT